MNSPPVIILGAARSGTKFLRDLLGAHTGFATIPYDVSYAWRIGFEDCPDDVLPTSRLDDGRIARIRANLTRLAGITANDPRRMLEKTVGNTLRVDFVDRVFPEARFVVLIRDGRAVTESAMRCWQAPLDLRALATKLRLFPWLSSYRYAWWFLRNRLQGRGIRSKALIWGPRYPGISSDCIHMPLHLVCARQWRHSVEATYHGIAKLSGERSYMLRYEDLVKNRQTLFGLLDFLEISDRSQIVAAYERDTQTTHSNAWRKRVAPAMLAEIETECGDMLGRLGYTLSACPDMHSTKEARL